MEAVGVDRGLGGTGWQAQGDDADGNPRRVITEMAGRQSGHIGNDPKEKKPLDAGERRGKFNGEEGRCDPNDQRDGYTRPHHADRALRGTVLIPEERGNVRAQRIAGRTAAHQPGVVWQVRSLADDVTPENSPPQANIQPTVPGGISATTSPHCSAQTTGGSGAGALYEEPDT